ncbi:4Fe-4S binding protein [Adlercreutzia sp. ZJ242]|uniref:indolepyruvate ferredoxin oxidoreductase subunit alpha n=1 Tax=Adlercreutzia sp. ZJ242 TaxID=2709409 RepID=UPI0013EA563E|nr:4Fe-4S binding protein [Adlercreutzia sp. ZJ242]
MKAFRYVIDQGICRACGSCAKACPASAVLRNADRSFEIDQALCDRCGACVQACKLRAIVKRRGLFR